MAAPPADVSDAPLTEQFKAAAKQAHGLNDALVTARLPGLFADRTIYGRAIGCFYPVFQELEEQLQEHIDAQGVRQLKNLLPRLCRTNGLTQDLGFYLGNDWEAKLVAGPEVQAYVKHVRELGRSNPGLLLVHSYTQHGGMLAGGQIISKWARKSLQLPPGQGVLLFDVQGLPRELMQGLRAAVNTAGAQLTAEEREQMVQEHVRVFEFNLAIVKSFRIPWTASVRGLVQLLPTKVLVAAASAALAVILGVVVTRLTTSC